MFVAVQVMYLFSCRSLTRPSWRLGVFSNRWIIGGVAVQVAGQLALTYIPVMNPIFGTAPLDGPAWAMILLVAVATMLVVSADKWWRARRLPPAAPLVSDARPTVVGRR